MRDNICVIILEADGKDSALVNCKTALAAIALLLALVGAAQANPDICFTRAAMANSQSLGEKNESDLDYWLNFSWSSKAMQDTLWVKESMWAKCYLWSDFPPLYNDFMGFSGNLVQNAGIQAHRFRFLLSENGDDFDLDPDAVIQYITYDEFECYNVLGKKALYEFDVYIDVSQFDSSGATTTFIGLMPSNASPIPPTAFFRLSGECGQMSIAIDTDIRLITAQSEPVPNEKTSFGRIKAIFR